MPSKYIKELIFKRDEGVCFHCGSEETTLHHRRNRGSGGDRTRSKVADRPSNLLTICPQFNGLMESDVNAYRLALEKGWKLKMGQSSRNTPVQNYDGTWWILTDMGGKFQLDDDRVN